MDDLDPEFLNLLKNALQVGIPREDLMSLLGAAIELRARDVTPEEIGRILRSFIAAPDESKAS